MFGWTEKDGELKNAPGHTRLRTRGAWVVVAFVCQMGSRPTAKTPRRCARRMACTPASSSALACDPCPAVARKMMTYNASYVWWAILILRRERDGGVSHRLVLLEGLV